MGDHCLLLTLACASAAPASPGLAALNTNPLDADNDKVVTALASAPTVFAPRLIQAPLLAALSVVCREPQMVARQVQSGIARDGWLLGAMKLLLSTWRLTSNSSLSQQLVLSSPSSVRCVNVCGSCSAWSGALSHEHCWSGVRSVDATTRPNR